MIDKYVDKIQNNGYTAVVYSQDAPTANTTRSLLGVFSPGTFFSVNNDEISNNLACIWIQSNTKTMIHGSGNIIIGMSNIDNFTGKSSFYEITTENIHNPTTYDELERFISTYNPSETILISMGEVINTIKMSTNSNTLRNDASLNLTKVNDSYTYDDYENIFHCFQNNAKRWIFYR